MEDMPLSMPTPPTVAHVAALAEKLSAERYGPSSELRRIQYCCTLLRTLLGSTPAPAFGPVALRSVQAEMVRRGLSREEVNRRIGSCRRIVRMAVAYELVPASVLEGLRCLEPLRAGRTEAHEMDPVVPVPHADWTATLAHLSPTLRSMVQIQAFTGCRTSEILNMKVEEIDRTTTPWVYRPTKHKGSWRGHVRRIPLGPRSRAVLAPALEGLAPSDFVFSPRRELERLAKERRAARRTPLYPSHMRDRHVANPVQEPHDHYSVQSYSRAITRACNRGGITRWRPYQLRHAHLTMIHEARGVEAAAAAGGHTSIQATQIYTSTRISRAVELAEEFG